MTDDRCLVRPRQKTAGATVYLVEELGDARMRCDQLVRYTSEAMRLIENSPHKDHFYEVAGHLLHAAPLTLFKLQKALQAVALAANRIDYEEIKTELRPEKVEQLEQVLEDVRIRQVQRHSEPSMTPQQVATKLRQFAATTRKFQLPLDEVVRLVTALETGYEDTLDDERAMTAAMLDGLADTLDTPGAKSVDKLAADWIQKAIKDPGALHTALGVPEGETIPTEKIKGELAKLSKKDDLSAADKKLQKQLNLALTLRGPKVKKADGSEQPSRLQLAAMLRRMVGDVQVRGHVGALTEAAKKKQAVPPSIAEQKKQAVPPGIAGLPPGIAEDEDDTKTAGMVWGRYEEGEDADKDNDGAPDNLSKEEAEKWKANTDKHKDKFKSKGAGRFVPIEKAKKGDMVQIEVGTPWPRPGTTKKEKVTGKVVRVKKDGVVTVDIERSSSNPGGHSNEDVGYVDVKLASTKKGSVMEGFKPDPAWVEGFNEAGQRNYEAIFGPNGEKDPGLNWKA